MASPLNVFFVGGDSGAWKIKRVAKSWAKLSRRRWAALN